MSGDEDFRTVADLGESRLVARIARRFGEAPAGEVWAGDDAAVLAWPGDGLVVTIDALTENVDFDFGYSTGADAGFKAIAASSSDVAAMGATPRHAVCALTLPPSTSMARVDAILDGMLEASGRWKLSLVGGDIGRASEISLAIAMTGRPLPCGPVLRSGARPGDALCITGTLGGAAGGLAVLRAGLREPWAGRLALRQLRPSARVAEAATLCEIGVTAMIDVSDGLAVDVERLCRASGVGCAIDIEVLPVDPDLRHIEGGDASTLAVTGGEDYELLCTMDPRDAERARTHADLAPAGLTVIGTVTDEVDVVIGGRGVAEWRETQWEHLRNP